MFGNNSSGCIRTHLQASPDQQGPARLIVALILSPLLPCRGRLRSSLRVIRFALDKKSPRGEL